MCLRRGFESIRFKKAEHTHTGVLCFFGGTYRTVVELTSRGTNLRFVLTKTD